MKNNIQLILCVALTFFLAGCAYFRPFKGGEPTLSSDVAEALAVFQQEGSDFSTRSKALDYLEEHLEETIDPLLEIVKTKGYRWQTVGRILARSKQEKVLCAYLDLLADNMFEKEADGSRKLSPPRGVSYGGNIAEFLGEMGDKRAIPVLRNAVDQGDHQVRWSALEALYYLDDISMDQLFEMGIKEGYPSTGHVILSIVWNDMRSDPTFILSVLDRYIDTFPEQEHGVSLAHMYKIECYEKLGRYDDALQQADIALKLPATGSNSELINKRKKRILDAMQAE